MEIEPFLVRSTVIGILAQRLGARAAARHCKEPYTAHALRADSSSASTRARTRARRAPPVARATRCTASTTSRSVWRGPGMPTFYKAGGCDTCDNKGFTGRRGIYELLDDRRRRGRPRARQAPTRRPSSARPCRQGMDTMRDDGARKVLDRHDHGRRGRRGDAGRRRRSTSRAAAMAVFEYRGHSGRHRQGRSRAFATPRTPSLARPCCARTASCSRSPPRRSGKKEKDKRKLDLLGLPASPPARATSRS